MDKEFLNGMDKNFIEEMLPFFQFLYYIYFRVETSGIINIPLREPALIVANHSGTLPYDGVMINLAVYNEHPLQRYARFLVEDFVVKFPLLNTFIKKCGGVPANHENATELLKRRELVAVFPEGVKGIGKQFDERYKLKEFGRGGFVRLAMKTKTTIVPCAVIGAEEIHPIIWKSELLAKPLGLPFLPFTPTFPWLGPLGLVPLPTKWKIVFGKPFSFRKFSSKDAENESLVMKHSKMIRSTVQKMINLELEKRDNIWR